MEQTWFDLPVESRLTEVWPRGLLKKNKMVPPTCKPADLSVPMPYWNLPVVSMDQKMPLLPGPKDLYHLCRSKLGKKLWSCEDSEFSLNEFIKKEIFNAYEILHDPNLAHYLRRPKVVRRLKELGLIDSELGVMCNLRDFNYYRRYLAFVHTNAINKLYRNQFLRGDKAMEMTNLCENLERQNAKLRIAEEIDKRHAEVFKEIEMEMKKKRSYCARRLKRVMEVYEKKKSEKEARRIAAREAAKAFTKKVKENLYYANAQIRQHKLDTMRKWRQQNNEKTALFMERAKQQQQGIINKKTEWFQNKIKHQEKRVLQETQINVLTDHEFSPEYKRYLKYIKRENYKNPPEHAAGPEYVISSESDTDEEETDLLNQLRLFTRAGHQLQRSSFISRAQARQSVARLANVASTRQGSLSHSQVRMMSQKFVQQKINMKTKKRRSVLEALINSSILRLLSPSLQDVFKKSERKWLDSGKAAKQSTVQGGIQAGGMANNNPVGPTPSATDVPHRGVMRDSQDSLDVDNEDMGGAVLGLPTDSQIDIRPPNKNIPPTPICHLNVYRYFDRVLGKVILEYVTRILLPKFPEIINRCYWVSKAEGLPEESSDEKPPCHPDDSTESYTDCMEKMRQLCDTKMASYMLLLSESPDIRLFRHKYNGIGEITCPETLVGNFMMQSSPHSQQILDYIHWRADWILNYPQPKTYQDINDLKYVIGVMKKIECPVFQPVYKLWEITNDIVLNPEVLDKFTRYMEKKKEQKPMVDLDPVDIAVKNVRKTMEPLIMDYKASSAIDDYCFRDTFKFPSELFRMTYLKRPVDPKIWKTLDELLDKTKRKPDDLECLRCQQTETLQDKLTQEVDFEELQLTAPECLFVDPRDYAQELQKARDKAEAEAEPVQRLRFGVTEFIPYIEKELFGGEKGISKESLHLDEEQKESLVLIKRKRSSILRTSGGTMNKERRRSKKKDSIRTSITAQRKETDLRLKLHGSSVGGGTKKSKEKDKKVTLQIVDKGKSGKHLTPPGSSKNLEEQSDKPDKEKTAKEDSFMFDTEDEVSKDGKTQEKLGKKGKGKEKDVKAKKKDKSKEGECNVALTESTTKIEEKEFKKKGLGEEALVKSEVADKETDDGKIKFKGKDDSKAVSSGRPERTRSLSILKGFDTSSTQKLDLSVKFKSKLYIQPHVLKALEVTDDLKKSKSRAPTPHPSFTSLTQLDKVTRASGDTSLRKEASLHSSMYKLRPCRPVDDSDETLDTEKKPAEKVSDIIPPARRSTIISKADETTKSEKLPDEEVKEVVLNVIRPEQDDDEDVTTEGRSASLESDLDHLRKFVEAKLPHKVIIPSKEKREATFQETVPVPPLINKSLLCKRRIIKRPLANILRKIYGWVMTTVIRRRLLISYGLPPKIRKECFFKTKFDSNELDLARGLAKLILEETSEFYPFAVLEPYIEIILEQTMDPTKRFDFTKKVVRMNMPLHQKDLESLQEFLNKTEEDKFYKRVRVRRLRKLVTCVRLRLEAINAYGDSYGGPLFNPQEWEYVFRAPRLDYFSYSCKRTTRYKVKPIFSYKDDDDESSSSTRSSDDSRDVRSKTSRDRDKSSIIRKSRASTRKSFFWLMKNDVKKDDPYDQWKPGFLEKSESSRNKILDIVVNKKADLAPSITEINDEMRRDFAYHKTQRKWLEKERQFRFITHLNMFSPILQPKPQDRTLMKFVQSPTYPYFGTFMTCQTFTGRRNIRQNVKTKTTT